MSDQPNSNKKILIVDDDKFLLDMYALKFNKSGYEVKTCDSTDGCLKLLREGYMPDIMLCDIVMPGMDGLDMVATVRKEKLAGSAKVIMLTNQGSPEDLSRAKSLNVDGYIIKATTIPSEVLAEVEKIISGKNK
ncbi:MAG: response regulator [Patescibacteria group bacterium]|nr:response regulator [Patescibacteria group bacterium]